MTKCERNKLKALITLSGNKRLPHLEEEIFADTELTLLYLTAIDPDGMACVCADAIPLFLVLYVSDVIKGPWPAAEHLIKPQQTNWIYYIRTIIAGPWQQPFIHKV